MLIGQLKRECIQNRDPVLERQRLGELKLLLHVDEDIKHKRTKSPSIVNLLFQ